MYIFHVIVSLTLYQNTIVIINLVACFVLSFDILKVFVCLICSLLYVSLCLYIFILALNVCNCYFVVTFTLIQLHAIPLSNPICNIERNRVDGGFV